MSKIRLRKNKESLIGIVLIVLLILLVIMNISVLIPTLQAVYVTQTQNDQKNPINTETVNEAMKFLESE